MKIFFNRLVLCVLAAVLCVSTPLRADDDDKPKAHLSKGMSKAQVKKIYGDPERVTNTDSGEMWTFVKDRVKAFIPFAGSAKIIVVSFNKAGKVASYNEQQ